MPDFREQVLDHIKCSHAALDAANTELTKTAAQQQQFEAMIPAVVDALVKFDRIEPSQREKAAELLKNPVKALEILLKTADTTQSVKPQALGTPSEKTASEVPKGRARYTGERTSEKTAADIAFEQAILGKR